MEMKENIIELMAKVELYIKILDELRCDYENLQDILYGEMDTPPKPAKETK